MPPDMPPDTSSNIPSVSDAKKIRIVVAGDCMLNRYVHGDVTRLSPEGPFPVLSVTHETEDPGGAGGVYANLISLGVDAVLVGAVADDSAGRALRTLCGRQAKFVTVADRPTILKTRFVAGGRQMLRADCEKTGPLDGDAADALAALAIREMENADALVLSDYAKGALTPEVLMRLIAAAKARNIPVLVDPKGRDFSIYKGADVMTPNRKELAEATGCAVANDSDIAAAAKACLAASGARAIVATRSEDGMSVLESTDGKTVHLKTEAREVADVSGAGDTVIAALAFGLAGGLSLTDAARLANRAAGIVVGKRGVCVITRQELFGDTEGGEMEDGGMENGAGVHAKVAAWKAQGLKVGFTNGCFDILHAGHVAYLAEAARLCDRLVVGLNHDHSVRILKGPSRPVNDETSRAAVVKGLASVDAVVLFGAETAGDDNTPAGVIGSLKPDIVFKGGDYTEDQLPEAKIVRAYGGEVRIMGLVEGQSTTGIIKKIGHKNIN